MNQRFTAGAASYTQNDDGLRMTETSSIGTAERFTWATRAILSFPRSLAVGRAAEDSAVAEHGDRTVLAHSDDGGDRPRTLRGAGPRCSSQIMATRNQGRHVGLLDQGASLPKCDPWQQTRPQSPQRWKCSKALELIPTRSPDGLRSVRTSARRSSMSIARRRLCDWAEMASRLREQLPLGWFQVIARRWLSDEFQGGHGWCVHQKFGVMFTFR